MNKPHLINYSDLNQIIGQAKSNWVQQSLPVTLNNTYNGKAAHPVVLTDAQPTHVAMIDAVISYLNGNGLLTCEVKFDHKEQTEWGVE